MFPTEFCFLTFLYFLLLLRREINNTRFQTNGDMFPVTSSILHMIKPLIRAEVTVIMNLKAEAWKKKILIHFCFSVSWNNLLFVMIESWPVLIYSFGKFKCHKCFGKYHEKCISVDFRTDFPSNQHTSNI